MYKNKVFRAILSWVWSCPPLERGARDDLVGLTQSYTCSPFFPPACHSPFLPSGMKLQKKLWTQLC